MRHRSFELDPRSPVFTGQTLDELVLKYEISTEGAHHLRRHVTDQAGELRVAWFLDRARPRNTRDAHLLIALAKQNDVGGETLERLFRAYFSEGADVVERDAQRTRD